MNLVNIQNLSEKFIYLNDDMIIWKPLEIERFFKNDLPIDFFSHSFIPRNKLYEIIKGKDTWIDSINNNIQLINQNFPNNLMDNNQLYHKSYGFKEKLNNFIYQYLFKKIIWINHWHHPQAYSKRTLEYVYKHFSERMLETSRHKFRSSDDITPYLYRYWHLMQGDFEPYFHNDAVVIRPSSVKHLKHVYIEIDQYTDINFICFNDQANDIDNDEFNNLSVDLSYYLEEKFSDKASFEKHK